MKSVKKQWRKWTILVLALLLCGSMAGAARVLLASEPRYAHLSTLVGIDIAGLTPQEALVHVEQALDWENRPMTLLTEAGDFTFTYGQLGFDVDIAEVLAQHRPPGWWRPAPQNIPLEVTVDEGRLQGVYQEVYARVHRPPISAQLSIPGDGRVLIEPHTLGVTLTYASMRAALWPGQLWDRLPPEPVNLPLEVLLPETSTEDLLALGLERCIGQFSTVFATSNVERSRNIELATAAIHGTRLAPGEVFSFNEVVGPRTAERDYGLANIFVGHEVRLGIGGGVCQVSTTLYNTALMANLEIVRRSSHGMTVDYVKIGLDAAVHYSAGQDLQFRNDTGYHLLLTGEVKDGRLTFCLYGTAPGDLKVETSSRVVETFPFETKIIEDPELPEGEELVTGGVLGRRVTAEARVFANGETWVRPLLPSYYIPIPKEIRIGTMPVPVDGEVAETEEKAWE